MKRAARIGDRWTAVAASIVFWTLMAEGHAAVPKPLVSWTFDEASAPILVNSAGKSQPNEANLVPGVERRALRFDGDHVMVSSSPPLGLPDSTFSICAWVNPYSPGGSQQMILAKNRYSDGLREWGLMIDRDNQFRFYLWQKGWKTLASHTEPRPGHWYHVAVTVGRGHCRLYINGKQEAEASWTASLASTDAPLSMGGVLDGGRLRQAFTGALDEVAIYREVLGPETTRALADKATTPHKVESIEPKRLWDGGPLPKTDAIPVLANVTFHVIKPHEPKVDGGNWLLGVALAWHKGRLFASYGFNKGSENTAGEEAHVRTSSDGGKTWSKDAVVGRGTGDLGISHGVFLEHQGNLWAFHGAFYGRFQRTHTRAYRLDDATGVWQPKGVVIDGGFWPLQEPLKMADGNWIMAGARVARGYEVTGDLPAVAISHGGDFTRWDLVVIANDPSVPSSSIWGESTVVVDGPEVLNVSRWGRPWALAAESANYGRTWAATRPTNLAMAASKPYCGTLSTGQHYLIGTSTADGGNRRSPLTIALTRPGEKLFSRVFVIRHAVFPEGPGPSAPNAQLCYPYAVEHEGKLYVGYAAKTYRTAELAVIPLESLR